MVFQATILPPQGAQREWVVVFSPNQPKAAKREMEQFVMNAFGYEAKGVVTVKATSGECKIAFRNITLGRRACLLVLQWLANKSNP